MASGKIVQRKQDTAVVQTIDRESTTVYLATAVLLIVFETWGKPAAYIRHAWGAPLLQLLGNDYVPYAAVLPFQFWGVASLIIRVVVPVLFIVAVLRASPVEYGFTLRGQRATARPYLLTLAAMLPVLWFASALPSFQAKYPLYRDAVLGGWHFWGYQLFYGVQFLGVEAFFRGFALFALARRIGDHAVWVMMIPYVMVHFGKPVFEVFAAIIAGVVLGRWALRSGSFLWGWVLHWAIAIAMDLMVVGRRLGLAGIVDVLR